MMVYDSCTLRDFMPGLTPVYMERSDPNWKSQKTRRKARRRLSGAPKAVRRRMGFKERRHG